MNPILRLDMWNVIEACFHHGRAIVESLSGLMLLLTNDIKFADQSSHLLRLLTKLLFGWKKQ